VFLGNLAYDTTIEDVLAVMDEVLGAGTVKVRAYLYLAPISFPN
jgi:hypothetical protein